MHTLEKRYNLRNIIDMLRQIVGQTPVIILENRQEGKGERRESRVVQREEERCRPTCHTSRITLTLCVDPFSPSRWCT